MLKQAVEKALNEQLNMEMVSYVHYLALSAFFAQENYPGIAGWFRIQANEERDHAMRVYDFILARGGAVALEAIARPQATWKSVQEAFASAFEGERAVTASIDRLVSLAGKESDHATAVFLQWFVTEQVEEEALMGEAVAQLERIDGSPVGMYVLDREMARRGEAPKAQ